MKFKLLSLSISSLLCKLESDSMEGKSWARITLDSVEEQLLENEFDLVSRSSKAEMLLGSQTLAAYTGTGSW